MTGTDHDREGETPRDTEVWPDTDIAQPPDSTGHREIWLFRDCHGELVCIS